MIYVYLSHFASKHFCLSSKESEDLLVPLPEDMFVATATETKLRIRKPNVADAGRYRVSAKNKYGSGNAIITLNIVGELAILGKLTKILIIMIKWPNGNARASCARGREFEFQATKSYRALQTVRHYFNIYPNSCIVLAL